jgi:hypothetical protein
MNRKPVEPITRHPAFERWSNVSPTIPQKKHRFLRFLKIPLLFLGAFFLGGVLLYLWLTLKPTGIEKIREQRTEILAEADRLIQESLTTGTLPVRSGSTSSQDTSTTEPMYLDKEMQPLDEFFEENHINFLISDSSPVFSQSFIWTLPRGEAVQVRLQSENSRLQSERARVKEILLKSRIRKAESRSENPDKRSRVTFAYHTSEEWRALHAALDKTEALLEQSWHSPRIDDYFGFLTKETQSFEPLAYWVIVRAGLRGQNDRAEFLFLRMIEITALNQRLRVVSPSGNNRYYVALAALWLAERGILPPENWGRVIETLERTRIKPSELVPLFQAVLLQIEGVTRKEVEQFYFYGMLSDRLSKTLNQNVYLQKLRFIQKPLDKMADPVNTLGRPLRRSWENERLARMNEDMLNESEITWVPDTTPRDLSNIGLFRILINPGIVDARRRASFFGQNTLLVREPRQNYVWYMESQDLVSVYYYVVLASWRAQHGCWPDRLEDVAGIFPFDEMTGVSPWKMTRIRGTNDSFGKSVGGTETTSVSQSQIPVSRRFSELGKEVPVVYQVRAHATLENGTVQYPEKEKEYLDRVKTHWPAITVREPLSDLLPEEQKQIDEAAREPGKPLDLELVEVFYPLCPAFADPDFFEGLRAGPSEDGEEPVSSPREVKTP